jgi:hypothetical protein
VPTRSRIGRDVSAVRGDVCRAAERDGHRCRGGGAGPAIIDPAEATATCGAPYGDSSSADQAKWAADSVVSSGATYDYPKTQLGFWYCANNSNEATGQGSFFVERVSSAKTVTCAMGQCQVEPAWTDPTAKLAMIDAIGAGCVPRHQ